jgi:hypothetical protein
MKTQLLKSEKHFNTSDFCLAISLNCLGFKVVAIDREFTNSNKFVFVFGVSMELNECISKYIQNQLKVNPIAFYSSSRELKSRMRLDKIYEV